MLLLCIGDLHIPTRCHDLPAKFKKLLLPGKIQQIVCLGNVTDQETYAYLKTIAADVQVVRGDYDENPAFPLSRVLVHPPLKIGALHGSQAVPFGDPDALLALARRMDVDVLLTGGTHQFQAFELDGRFFISPGSATGAYSGFYTTEPTPSFALLDIQGPVVVTYVYQLKEGEVKVDKIEYRKPTPESTRSPPGAGAVQQQMGSPPPPANQAGVWA